MFCPMPDFNMLRLAGIWLATDGHLAGVWRVSGAMFENHTADTIFQNQAVQNGTVVDILVSGVM